MASPARGEAAGWEGSGWFGWLGRKGLARAERTGSGGKDWLGQKGRARDGGEPDAAGAVGGGGPAGAGRRWAGRGADRAAGSGDRGDQGRVLLAFRGPGGAA